jgi:hypothetical protein
MIRRIFAGSVVALLVSVSALAAACDLSCAFASMNSDCPSQQTATQDSASDDVQMDGMAMTGMTMPGMAGGEDRQMDSAVTRANAGHPSICEMGPCEKQACDSGDAVSTGTNRFVNASFHFIVAITEPPAADHAPPIFHGARDDVASDHPGDASPLQLSLRI